ncbi:hypothetical protein BDK51DRAFT_43208 [Blyttiomyces helicus]|uniref:Uncharacterized protein n=1 Tax=Blyttiomyces helicus TaxID=388810 RepID=A0A4P9WCS1_9FUNG|nr:hypothetical protein BDK51DRAFT_43208 [Blyttiomyces helicus]|eukprot:RKO88166.1 hypothetical protein BDK51DRAFT_43208 [Blyttiomyces helicus]
MAPYPITPLKIDTKLNIASSTATVVPYPLHPKAGKDRNGRRQLRQPPRKPHHAGPRRARGLLDRNNPDPPRGDRQVAIDGEPAPSHPRTPSHLQRHPDAQRPQQPDPSSSSSRSSVDSIGSVNIVIDDGRKGRGDGRKGSGDARSKSRSPSKSPGSPTTLAVPSFNIEGPLATAARRRPSIELM